MQKTNNRTPMNTAKVAKKAKKMGTPSPPKKKKGNEIKIGDTVINAAATKTPRTKMPVKKIAVVAKKCNVGKKELKVAVKKKTPIKIPAQIKKIIKKPVGKKVKPPKITPEKGEKADKPDKAEKPEKPDKTEKKVTTPKQSQTEKSTEKNEENEVVISKAKKVKKSEDETTKTTAKKQNSKLSKKSNDTEPAVKPLPSTIVHNEVVKDVAKNSVNKKSNDKKSGCNTEKTEENIVDEVKSKTAPKKKIVKAENKVVKKIPVEKKIVKKVQKTIKTEVVEEIDKIKKDDIVVPKGELEKKTVKKEPILEIEKDKEKDKKLKSKEDEESDKETKETIAKLLKEVNKTILKSPTKKKRETLNSKTSPNNSIIKKSKIIAKPKPKKQEILIKVKTESTDSKDETIQTPQKKVVKKLVAKPKKKVVVKTEEETEPKKEKIKKPEKDTEDKSKTTDDEKNTNTDDSTTSDEITLNLLRQTQSSSPSQTQSQSEKPSDEPVKPKIKKKIKIKSETSSDTDRKSKPMKQIKKTVVKKIQQKKKMLLLKNKMRKITKERKRSTSTDTEQQKNRKLKLYSWWTGPKRHRVASLNALAKVHCLYENESRGALYDVIKRSPVTKESNSEGEPDNEMDGDTEPSVEPSTRTLRSVPGLRGVGKHWEMHDETSSSSCEEASNDSSVEAPKRKLLTPPPSYKQKEEKRKEAEKKPAEEKEKIIEKKKPVRKRRNRTELIMDLKDMVVRKRMASLNASAILAASYSAEKKPFRSPKSESSTETSDTDDSMASDTIEKEFKRKCYDSDVSVKKEESSDRKVIEVRASPNKKVAVILNQDTDVTITGVYVNSTTRSTHHEGYCSIAGMQYRISATSHTQTAATAVATETLLHSSGEHGPPEQPCKSYTPLGALSNMQPPGSHPHAHPHGHGHPPHVVPPAAVSPSGRRHGCTSAFAAPPPTQYGPPHHHHHGPHPPPPPLAADQQPPPAYIHGYYQPAGPLITAHHGHSHPPPAPAGKTAPLPTLEASPSPTPPPTTHQPPPSSTGTAESSDNEVIITSASSGSAEQVPVALPAAQTYRYATSSQYPAGTHAPPGYSYSYPPSQYYHSAPAGFAQQQHYHHDICYPGSAYPPSYLHPKAYTTTFRRYLPPPSGPQYYPANPELYSAPPSSGQSSQVVTASSGAGGSTYQAPPTGPPPPTLVESYAPPPPVPPTIVEPYPPPHYYTPSYGSGPAPPPCFSHSPPTRNLAFIEPAYQSCPCPMQSCPKNVHTGPLTGDGKRSNVIAKESSMPLPLPLPLPPVALALPLEPASVAGPPSPARGSAGMPPPPSPAGATYQPTPTPSNKWDAAETEIDTKTTTPSVASTARTKPRLGKSMVRNTILSSSNSNNNNNNNNNSITNNNNINATAPQGMLLMCHNQSATAQTPPQQADVKREVESPEEQKPTPETVVEIPPTPIPPSQIDPQPKPKAKAKTKTETETESETEVQNHITEECSKRLSPEDVNVNQKLLKNEECGPNGPVRRKSNVHVDAAELPQQQQAPPQNETSTILNHLEKTSTKRKVCSAEEEPVAAPQTKKQKPNGSYKNLIKRSTNNKCIKINNGKRKLILESELKPVTEGKPPKIMLGKNKKATKRKNNINNNTTAAAKEEPVVKRAKTSKPLIERNLHTLKQNVRLKDKQQHQESIENKEPVVNVAKKTVQRKNQVNSKCSTLNNVDRTIESVILNCVYVEETLRTSDSVLKQVVDKQNNNKQNCNNKQTNVTDINKTTDTTITSTAMATATATATTTVTTATTKQNANVTRVTHATKAAKIGCGRAGTTKRKSKDKPLLAIPLPVSRIPRRSFNLPKWSNGWSWEGDSFQGKVFINSDEPLVVRKCYPAMRHQEGDVISPRDCVLLKAGPRKIDLPFVAKVAALWEDEEGEMMMSLLWYYRPEHTEQGRRPIDQPDEVFASRHKDTNSVACIEDKCYVLTFNEYCRYRKNVRRIEEGMEQTEQIVPLPEGGQYFREHRQPPALLATAPDLVFFCRQVYDFRQKRIVKNPS